MPTGVYERTPEHGAKISVGRKNSDAVKAHNESMRGVPKPPAHCAALSEASKGVPKPKTPEHCAAISKGKTGVPNSPEHNDAITKGCKNSDAVKAKIETMRGGNDIVTHHYIYDHSDLSKYTIKMTRKDHSRSHLLLRRLGYKFPHINTGHENEEEIQ